MTKKEAERQTMQADVLRSLGFSSEEAEQLRRISMTLHRWHEMECGIDNGCIERDETTGKAYWLNSNTMRRTPMVDREKGALKRLKAIVDAVNVQRAGKVGPLRTYIQGDPRGAALYILRPGDVPEGADDDGYYNRRDLRVLMNASLICAWCQQTIRQGDPAEDPSHGCCADCAAAILRTEREPHEFTELSFGDSFRLILAMILWFGILGWVFYEMTKG